jgi:hypothetical protein
VTAHNASGGVISRFVIRNRYAGWSLPSKINRQRTICRGNSGVESLKNLQGLEVESKQGRESDMERMLLKYDLGDPGPWRLADASTHRFDSFSIAPRASLPHALPLLSYR